MLRAVIIDDEPVTERIIRFFAERGDQPLEIAASAPNGKLGVADQAGYDSLNNFYKYFKRYTGTTPAEYH